MIDTVELLTFEVDSRLIGVEISEVDTITMTSSLKNKAKDFLEPYNKNNTYFDSNILFNFSKIQTPEAYISFAYEEHVCCVGVSHIHSIINAEITNILALPDYVMDIQNPLFVWGCCLHEDSLILLVTFQYLLQEGAHG